MIQPMKTEAPDAEKRDRRDRRDELSDRRLGDRRQTEQRKGERRVAGRRKDFCPTCEGDLTPTAYCPSCKVRVVKIRASVPW